MTGLGVVIAMALAAVVMAALVAAPVLGALFFAGAVIGFIAAILAADAARRAPRVAEAELDELVAARLAEQQAHALGLIAHAAGDRRKEEAAALAEAHARFEASLIEHAMAPQAPQLSEEQQKEW